MQRRDFIFILTCISTMACVTSMIMTTSIALKKNDKLAQILHVAPPPDPNK